MPKASKVAKELNITIDDIHKTLAKHNIKIEDGPNARMSNEAYEILQKIHISDKKQNQEKQQFLAEREKEKNEKKIAKENRAKSIPTEVPTGLKVVGYVDLDGNKNKQKEETVKNETPVVNDPETKADEIEKIADAPVVPVEEKEIAAETPAEKSTPVAEISQNDNLEEKKEEKEEEKAVPQQEKNENETERTAENKSEENEVKETEHNEVVNESETPETSDATAETPETKVVDDIPQLKGIQVVGQMNIDKLNQLTRPQKKDRKKENNERKKKRDRIKDGKIDIAQEVQKQQVKQPADTQKQDKNSKNDRRDKDRGKDRGKNRREKRPEINKQEIEEQYKDTLGKFQKKQNIGYKHRKDKREAFAEREREQAMKKAAESKILQLTEFVTANDLAVMMNRTPSEIISTCFAIGKMVSINQRLDAETIDIVAEEFGFKTQFVSEEVVNAIAQEEDKEEDLISRPPIVTVMGHVDHGKTKLLDYIRKSNVVAGEAGGITQHIGAYNVTLEDGRKITFLDTPGHEAFTAMRARGAKVTDICIIIISATESIMPTTIEAINHAVAADTPMVFAINKIDQPRANPEKIKEELANMNYLVEDWGGKYQSQDISAKVGTGVDELLEKVLLEAEMLELKANPNRKAVGSIIESSLDKGRGYTATVLVQNGTLHVGDIILAGTFFGRVKAMYNERGQRITEVGPSEPASILGLNGAPAAGDTLNVMDTEQEAREIATKRIQLQREQATKTTRHRTLEDVVNLREQGEFHELNIIVKGDVDGSIEAIQDALIKLSTPEVKVNVIHKAVGAINESDVSLATASDAIIIGFQVRPVASAKKAAEREGVQIRLYSVIYQAIDDVKAAMEGMLEPEIKEEVTGTAEILQTFHISKVGTVAGCIVREGRIKRATKVRVIRDGIVIHTGDLAQLKRMKDDVKEVLSGYECGLKLATFNDIKEKDIIEGFEEIEVKKKL